MKSSVVTVLLALLLGATLRLATDAEPAPAPPARETTTAPTHPADPEPTRHPEHAPPTEEDSASIASGLASLLERIPLVRPEERGPRNGRVTMRDGTPLSGVTVRHLPNWEHAPWMLTEDPVDRVIRATRNHRNTRHGVVMTVSDADGQFAFSAVPPGGLELELEGYTFDWVRTTGGFEEYVGSRRASVPIEVVLDDDRPVDRAQLELEIWDGYWDTLDTTPHPWSRETPEVVLSEGLHRVVALADGYRSEPITFEVFPDSTETVRLVLRGTARIQIDVVCPSSGPFSEEFDVWGLAVPSGASIDFGRLVECGLPLEPRVIPLEGEEAESTRRLLVSTPPGPVLLGVIRGYSPRVEDNAIFLEVVHATPGLQEIVIELEAEPEWLSPTLFVTSPDAYPVTTIEVFVVEWSRGRWGRIDVDSTLLPEGGHRLAIPNLSLDRSLDPLDPETCLLQIDSRFGTLFHPLGGTRIDLQYPPRATVILEVAGELPESMDFDLTIRDEDGRELLEFFDTLGAEDFPVTLEGLSPGRFDFDVNWDHGSLAFTADLAAGENRVPIPLPPRYTLSLRFPAGAELSNVDVQGGRGAHRSRVSAGDWEVVDGRWRTREPLLGPGTHAVEVTYRDGTIEVMEFDLLGDTELTFHGRAFNAWELRATSPDRTPRGILRPGDVIAGLDGVRFVDSREAQTALFRLFFEDSTPWVLRDGVFRAIEIDSDTVRADMRSGALTWHRIHHAE